jgi:hypothetical protein
MKLSAGLLMGVLLAAMPACKDTAAEIAKEQAAEIARETARAKEQQLAERRVAVEAEREQARQAQQERTERAENTAQARLETTAQPPPEVRDLPDAPYVPTDPPETEADPRNFGPGLGGLDPSRDGPENTGREADSDDLGPQGEAPADQPAAPIEGATPDGGLGETR